MLSLKDSLVKIDQATQVRELLGKVKNLVDENRGPLCVNFRNEGNGFQVRILVKVSKDLYVARASGMKIGTNK